MIKSYKLLLGRIIASLLVFVFLAGCSAFKIDNKAEMPAEDLAKKGLEQYNRGKYFQAGETFQIIKERFPFSRFSMLAELKSADCKFYMKDYAGALDFYQEFEKNHPANEAMPYVLFQVGRSYYRTIDQVGRDTTGAKETVKALTRLIRTYPDSSYTEEATSLIKKSNNFLADYELSVASFYFRTKKFAQARGRAEYLIAIFPDSPAAEQARELLNEVGEQGDQ